MLLFSSCLTSSQIPCQNKNHLRFKENKMQTILFRNLIRRLCSRRELIIFLLWNTFSLNQKKFVLGFFMVLDLVRMQFYFSASFQHFDIFHFFNSGFKASLPDIFNVYYFKSGGWGGHGSMSKMLHFGLFVCECVHMWEDRQEVVGTPVNGLIMSGDKQTVEWKSTHTHTCTHTSRAWVGHLDARWTLTWKEKQGEACYRRTRLHTHTHAHAGHRCPSLAHAVASQKWLMILVSWSATVPLRSL